MQWKSRGQNWQIRYIFQKSERVNLLCGVGRCFVLIACFELIFGTGDFYLSGDFAVVVKVVEGESPLLPVILLHRHGTLQLLKQQNITLSTLSTACMCVYLYVWVHCPSFIQRGRNKRPVQCWHSLQTGAVSVALREIGCHLSCIFSSTQQLPVFSGGKATAATHTRTHTHTQR